jgi:hypothetical protein
VDSIIILQNGELIGKGTYKQLLENCKELKTFMKTYLAEDDNNKQITNDTSKNQEKFIPVKKMKAKTNEGQLLQKEKIKSGNVCICNRF